MKRLAVFLAVVATGVSVYAADDVEIKNSGDFRARYMNYMNPSGGNDGGNFQGVEGRFRLNLSARKGEKLQAYASVIHNSVFGSEQTSTGQYTSGGTSDLLVVSRAWGWWKATDSLSFKVGRFGIAFGDGAFFDENKFNPYPTTFEGLDAAWDSDFATLNFYAIKTHQYTNNYSTAYSTSTTSVPQIDENNSDAERNFFMVSADLKNMPEMIKTANVHILQISKDATSGASTTGSYNSQVTSSDPVGGAQSMQHIGLTVAGENGNILWKLDGAYQMGTFNNVTGSNSQSISANMFDITAGYKLPETMNMKITANFHMDSGTTGSGGNAVTSNTVNTYQSLYYDGHDISGLMDVVRWGNLTYWDLHVTVDPTEDLNAGVGYFMYNRTNTSDTTMPFAGGRYFTALGLGDATQQQGLNNVSAIGSEVDAWATKSYDGGLKLTARYGAFMPGSLLTGGSIQHNKTMMEAMLEGSFAF